MKWKLRLIPLFFLISLMVILPVQATENQTINVTQFPELVGDAFNIEQTVAEYLLSAAVLLSIGLALAYLNAKGLILITVEFISMAGLIAIGWLPSFLMLIVVLLVSLMYAGKIKRSF